HHHFHQREAALIGDEGAKAIHRRATTPRTDIEVSALRPVDLTGLKKTVTVMSCRSALPPAFGVMVTVRRKLGYPVMVDSAGNDELVRFEKPWVDVVLTANARTCSSFCSARNTAVLVPRLPSTPATPYMRAERTTAMPTISMVVAMRTSASEKPRVSRNPWMRPFSVSSA